MRMEIVQREKRVGRAVAGSAAQNLGLRRPWLRRRWRDETAYIMRSPANVAWIKASVAELDLWREASGIPPFDRRHSDGDAP